MRSKNGQHSEQLFLSSVFIHFATFRPAEATRWDTLGSERDEKAGDAVILGPDGIPELVIRAAPCHPRAALRALHEHWSRIRRSYEVW